MCLCFDAVFGEGPPAGFMEGSWPCDDGVQRSSHLHSLEDVDELQSIGTCEPSIYPGGSVSEEEGNRCPAVHDDQHDGADHTQGRGNDDPEDESQDQHRHNLRDEAPKACRCGHAVGVSEPNQVRVFLECHDP